MSDDIGYLKMNNVDYRSGYHSGHHSGRHFAYHPDFQSKVPRWLNCRCLLSGMIRQ